MTIRDLNSDDWHFILIYELVTRGIMGIFFISFFFFFISLKFFYNYLTDDHCLKKSFIGTNKITYFKLFLFIFIFIAEFANDIYSYYPLYPVFQNTTYVITKENQILNFDYIDINFSDLMKYENTTDVLNFLLKIYPDKKHLITYDYNNFTINPPILLNNVDNLIKFFSIFKIFDGFFLDKLDLTQRLDKYVNKNEEFFPTKIKDNRNFSISVLSVDLKGKLLNLRKCSVFTDDEISIIEGISNLKNYFWKCLYISNLFFISNFTLIIVLIFILLKSIPIERKSYFIDNSGEKINSYRFYKYSWKLLFYLYYKTFNNSLLVFSFFKLNNSCLEKTEYYPIFSYLFILIFMSFYIILFRILFTIIVSTSIIIIYSIKYNSQNFEKISILKESLQKEIEKRNKKKIRSKLYTDREMNNQIKDNSVVVISENENPQNIKYELNNHNFDSNDKDNDVINIKYNKKQEINNENCDDIDLIKLKIYIFYNHHIAFPKVQNIINNIILLGIPYIVSSLTKIRKSDHFIIGNYIFNYINISCHVFVYVMIKIVWINQENDARNTSLINLVLFFINLLVHI